MSINLIYEFVYAVFIAYAALFPVLNPLGGSLIFSSITYTLAPDVNRRLAIKIALNTFLLLTAVLLIGTWILKLFGIAVPIVQLGGGAVVATRGWMIMNTGDDPKSVNSQNIVSEEAATAASFFPLTLPLTAGPGAITVAITLGAEEVGKNLFLSLMGYAGAVIGIILSALTVYFSYHYAGYLLRRLGQNGRVVIMKLSAFITLCIGLTIVWKGVQGLIALYLPLH